MNPFHLFKRIIGVFWPPHSHHYIIKNSRILPIIIIKCYKNSKKIFQNLEDINKYYKFVPVFRTYITN